MKIRFNLISLAILLLFMLSCQSQGENKQLLLESQKIVERDPHKALILLDSIKHPDKLEKDYYMQYILTKTQAKLKTGQDVSSDTLIFTVQEYYNKLQDTAKMALANFYAASVCLETEKSSQALASYLKAIDQAQQVGDSLLIGRAFMNIGYLYYRQEIMDSAITYYHRALIMQDKLHSRQIEQLKAINMIGLAYEDKSQLDSAQWYFEKTLDLANQLGNKEYLGYTYNNLGLVAYDKKKYKEASGYMLRSITYPIPVGDSIKVYMNLARTYTAINKLDSAKHYTGLVNQRIAQIKDLHILALVYEVLALYNKAVGNAKETFKYTKLHEQTQKQIMERNQAQDLRKARAEADQEHTSKIIFLVTAVCLLATLGVLTVYGRKRVRELRQSKDEWVTRLVETEVRLTKQNLETQEEVRKQNLNTLKVQQVGHCKYFDHWYKIDKEVKSLGYKLGTSEEPTIYKRIVDMEEDSRTELIEKGIEWAKDYITLNLPNGEKAVSTMTDKELIMFMLCFCRYTHKEMAIFLNVAYNKNNINMRKLDVRNKLKWAGVPSDMSEELIFGTEEFCILSENS